MATHHRRPALVLLAILWSVSLPGCGYSLAGRGSFLPAYIKVIGVPTFANNTPVFDIERRITDRVRAELIGRGKYKVLPQTEGVDGLLQGEILSIAIVPSAFNEARQATRYALVLTAKIEFKDVKENKVIWSNGAMQFREEYDVVTNTQTATDPNAFFGQDVNALDRLAAEFARTLVSAILEAF
jgi:hypothetical protein